MVKFLKQHSVVLFFALTFVIAWSFWIPATAAKLNGGISVLAPDHPLGQLGRWAPGIAAILLTLAITGKQGIKKLFEPLGIWRVNIGWYAIALLLQPLIVFTARLLDRILGNQYQDISPPSTVYMPLAFVIPVMIISAFPGSFAEELGWRGFALPRLQKRTSALIASMILAITWGIWHIPSMVYFGQVTVVDVSLAILNFIPITILYTWMYNNSQGSLLLVTLFHLSQQLSNNFLGTIPTMTDDILMWLIMIVVIALGGLSNLSQKQTAKITA